MKLKKLTHYAYPALLATSLSMACATTYAATSAPAFEGAYGQIATGYSNNSEKLSNSPGEVLTTNSAGTAPAIIGLGYNFTVAPSWVLGLGVDYNAINSKQNAQSTIIGYSGPGATGSGTVTTKNQLSAYIAPGYELAQGSLVYAKLGYASAKYNLDTGESGNLNGYLLGLGYKMKITGGLYGYVEGNYINYAKSTYSGSGYSFQFGGNNYNALLGVGYQF